MYYFCSLKRWDICISATQAFVVPHRALSQGKADPSEAQGVGITHALRTPLLAETAQHEYYSL